MEVPRCHARCVLLLTVLLSSVQAYLPTYFMDDWCSTTLDLGVRGIEAGRLLLRPPERGMRYLNCLLFLKAPPGKRLVLKFRGFDIQSPFDCRNDHLQVFDDNLLQQRLTDQLCNSGLRPSGMYTTTNEQATIRLRKENYLGDQIELIFTAFHLAPCRGGEFKCSNGNCIHQDLYCNDYDNCGDGSDQCLLSPGGIAGVVIAAVVVIIIIAVIIALVMHRRKRRLEKEYEEGVLNGTLQKGSVVHGPGGPIIVLETPYAEAWDRKSPISRSNSTATSTLSMSSRNGYSMTDMTDKAENSRAKNVHSVDKTNAKNVNSVVKTKDGNPDITYIKDDHFKSGTLEGRKLKSSIKSKKSGRSSGKDSKLLMFGIDGPLKSSTLKKKKKKEKTVPGPFDIYAVPNKGPRLLRRSSSLRYANDPRFLHPHRKLAASNPDVSETFWQQPFDRNASFIEGMRGDGVSRYPVHTLDASRLAWDYNSFRSPDAYDHVISFRSYPSLPRDRENVVSNPNQGYHRLREQDGDRASIHSSRSSLVKL